MDKSIANIIKSKLIALDTLILKATDKEKIYYEYMRMNLLKLLKCYEINKENDSINNNLQMNLFLHEKDKKIIDTILSSRKILEYFTDNILDYFNSTPMKRTNTSQNIYLNNQQMFESMLKNNDLYDIYKEYESKEIIDINKNDNKMIRGYSSFYNLLDLDGQHLIYINGYYNDIETLVKIAHEYGHFLSDYFLNFDIEKITQKNTAYNEIISEILYYKMSDYLRKNNIIDEKINTNERNSFMIDSVVLYIFSHYDIDYNDQEILEIIKEDIKYKYPKMNINISYLSNDRVIYAFMYLIAQYIGELYKMNDKEIKDVKNILLKDKIDLITLFENIGLTKKDLIDKTKTENNLEKIFVKK